MSLLPNVATCDKLLTQAYKNTERDREEGQRERLKAIKEVAAARKIYLPLANKHRKGR